MLLACERLQNSDDALSCISAALGYESESAFSKAFKRVIGCAPRQVKKIPETIIRIMRRECIHITGRKQRPLLAQSGHVRNISQLPSAFPTSQIHATA